jgi:probable phosphoglycerate mutase
MAQGSMPTSRIVYLARHGETDWNVAGRWQGHTDVPLNDTGREQARALVPRLRPFGLAAAVASDLSRARETAEIVALGLGVPLAYTDPALRERSFGVFEGLTRAECERQHAEAWRVWLAERRPPPGAETQPVLAERVVAAATRVALQVATDLAPALIVTHGGALRALVSTITGEMPPLVKNGELWRVEYAGRFVEARRMGSGEDSNDSS